MSVRHKKLVKAAIKAINEVFADKTVPVATTRSSLRELREEIEVLEDAIQRDK